MQSRAPKAFPLAEFGQWLVVLGVAKARIRGRESYLGIALVEVDEQPDDHSVEACKDRFRSHAGASRTLPVLYEDYLAWAGAKEYTPFAKPQRKATRYTSVTESGRLSAAKTCVQ